MFIYYLINMATIIISIITVIIVIAIIWWGIKHPCPQCNKCGKNTLPSQSHLTGIECYRCIDDKCNNIQY